MKLFGLVLLPLLVAADQQPLRDQAAAWFDKAKAFVDSNLNAANPVEAAAAQVADATVVNITQRNWERRLSPQSNGPTEWLLYLSGGNKSCFGRCGKADEAWNFAVPRIVITPSAPKLGYLNCEKEDVLCTAWSANLPSLWHFDFPQRSHSADQSTPRTPLHIMTLNVSTLTSADIVSIVSDKKWLTQEEYTGSLHPVDGMLRQYGLLMPLGWFLWGFGSTPSWLVMIVISFFSRQWMAKKTQSRPGLHQEPGFGPGRGARPAAAQAAPASPQGGRAPAGKAGGKKKR